MLVKESFFANGANFVGNMALAFCLPAYSTRMVRGEPRLNAVVVGITMAATALAYAVSLPINKKLIRKLSRRWVIYMGHLIMVFALCILASDPGQYISITAKITINVIGNCIVGIGLGFCLIPLFPEILDATSRSAKS